MEQKKSVIGPFWRSSRFVLLLLILVVIAQLFLHKAEDRPEVACFAAYKLVRFTTVTIPGVVLPREHTFIVQNIFRAERFHGRCLRFLGGMPYFSGSATKSVPDAGDKVANPDKDD